MKKIPRKSYFVSPGSGCYGDRIYILNDDPLVPTIAKLCKWGGHDKTLGPFLGYEFGTAWYQTALSYLSSHTKIDTTELLNMGDASTWVVEGEYVNPGSGDTAATLADCAALGMDYEFANARGDWDIRSDGYDYSITYQGNMVYKADPITDGVPVRYLKVTVTEITEDEANTLKGE